ncbi:hypothetical protein B0T16DRAFT_81309 [Cercophora newfieldiana]|uniref:Uncharacterized protein n=1 Tax=Cercophora newfieldiana TaxID=92897 RepID=A0AA39YF69_9PEZI|nr:hypothetical protein B0T16DRAFT_81309 [Cercophora newfieldiana]
MPWLDANGFMALPGFSSSARPRDTASLSEENGNHATTLSKASDSSGSLTSGPMGHDQIVWQRGGSQPKSSGPMVLRGRGNGSIWDELARQPANCGVIGGCRWRGPTLCRSSPGASSTCSSRSGVVVVCDPKVRDMINPSSFGSHTACGRFTPMRFRGLGCYLGICQSIFCSGTVSQFQFVIALRRLPMRSEFSCSVPFLNGTPPEGEGGINSPRRVHSTQSNPQPMTANTNPTRWYDEREGGIMWLFSFSLFIIIFIIIIIACE